MKRGQELWGHWASLGVSVAGKVDPLEDPEALISESLECLEEEERLLSGIATWLKEFGYLVNVKKLKFKSERGKRLFWALVDAVGSLKAKHKQRPSNPGTAPEFVIRSLVPTLQEWARKDPDPTFLRHGFLLKRHNFARPKILLPHKTVFARSKILRMRALHGPTLRSDLLAVLPEMGEVSLHELARRLHVSAPSVHPIVQDLVQSKLVEWATPLGRGAKLRWISKVAA